MSDYRDALQRLTAAYTVRTRAADPVTARSKPTDSPPPNGVRNGYGTRQNTNANRANGGGSCYYRARAADYAGSLPATTRPSAVGRVKPTTGIRLNGSATTLRDGKREPSAALLQAKADGEHAGMRTEVSAQASFTRSVGEVPLNGVAYGRGIRPENRCAPLPD